MEPLSYSTKIPSQGDYDVIVLGGGPSGIMAAAAAARSGARTALIEQYGFLGGMATAGLVAPVSVFRYHDELVVGGLPWEFVQRMESEGGAKIEYPLGNVSFSPEYYKLTAHRLMKESEVSVYLHTRLIDCKKINNQITDVILHSKCGLFSLHSDIFIDCTGDGDLAALAGAPMQQQEGELQPASLYFCLGHVNTSELPMLHHSQQGQNYHIENLRVLLQSIAARETLPEFGGPWMCYMMTEDTVLVNMTRRKTDILKETDATEAEFQLREDAFQLVEVLKQHVPAFANSNILYTATQIGVRESRHIEGVHILRGDEYLNAVHFEDSIARGCHPVDIHSADGDGQRCEFLKQAAYIPYRSLITKEISNLLVACRAFSADRTAFASARVQATMMGIGQAAGTAAAQCSANSLHVQDVDIPALRQSLIAFGAVI